MKICDFLWIKEETPLKGGGEAFAIEAGTAGSAIISMIYKLPDLI